jgi:hypothetical protein
MNGPALTAPANVEQLEDALSAPTPGVIDALQRLDGDLLVLGVGGKMGPTLARMAVRATQAAGNRRRVIGVSRFSSANLRERLERWGVETIACDLLQEEQVRELPECPQVLVMTGMKFGTSTNPALSWAMNCYVPALICGRYRQSRIAAFSSGNVYGLVPRDSGGSVETDAPRPVGEYAITVLGRERMYEYFSREWQIPLVLLRLNYATELRYGVLVDLAHKVFREEICDVGMGFVNVIWQRDANALALQSLAHAAVPPLVLNIAGPEILRIRDVLNELGRLLDKRVRIEGHEGQDALLNNASRSHQLFGLPVTPVADMLQWTAAWVRQGGDNLGKPTHFESRDGTF